MDRGVRSGGVVVDSPRKKMEQQPNLFKQCEHIHTVIYIHSHPYNAIRVICLPMNMIGGLLLT